ncbi:hypothetical protein CIPAW_01G106400 [Carya illinoinensis]|uniref:Fungal lipase-like domain-containing protein n=1 Tax=Carya illinoinensis TaxID=32201 RepID=A0A8T1RNV7_CARIL|nr:hypothetical protein CIPAW_01G106400 [Carya illinoinensis]KAG6667522.1 hypothetical protein CIPAW_01G106400 [Carya illinoinensis]
MIMACLVALVQCFAGSDVVNWRSYYATKDNAWKAHYLEVFDNGMREALCCLGRVRYLSVLEEDEVYSVARLLGDLVAYRASGTGHLELLAVGQFVSKNSAFLELSVACKCCQVAACNSPSHGPGMLRADVTLCKAKCEAAYFIVVLHHLRSVVVAVRGTETPEDLITDGLCKECILSAEDLHGLMNSSHVHPDVKLSVESSFPHYGHSGILGAAQDLFRQIDGNPGDYDAECKSSGFLSSLLGAGCECDGYDVRIVGHSLGGAIAALLGIKLYRRYRNLHVFAYGPLPCVDAVVADACSEFVTSCNYCTVTRYQN